MEGGSEEEGREGWREGVRRKGGKDGVRREGSREKEGAFSVPVDAKSTPYLQD